VNQIIQQACTGLAGEIQRSIEFFLATSGESEISKIFICGGSAYLAPLAKAIEKRARVPVELLDPIANMPVDPKAGNEADFRAKASQIVVALGLGLRCDREKRTWSA